MDNSASSVPKSTLGDTGYSVLSSGLPGFSGLALADTSRTCLSARGPPRNGATPDPNSQELAAAESQFFSSSMEKDRIHQARHQYPRRVNKKKDVDPLTGEEDDVIPRRIMGFGLGFEKIFATTSTKLPISAYTIFLELHTAHNGEVFSRCFTGLHTVLDLKKWIFEKLLVPMNAYDLSYAEPGKVTLTDQLRLLTTQDSLDTRTLATTRAARMSYLAPGVHSLGDVGVTRLYVRLKCRTCGNLLNSLQTCRKFKTFCDIEPPPDSAWPDAEPEQPKSKILGVGAAPDDNREKQKRMTLAQSQRNSASVYGVPGSDPTIEDCWYRPDEKKHCLFHTRGNEMYEAARTHGGHAELARIYISCGKEPSKKLKLADNVLSAHANAKISY